MNERSAVAGQVAVPNEHLCRLAGNCLQHQLNTHNYTRSPALGRARSHRDSGRGVASSAHRRPSFILHPRPRRWRSRLTPRPYTPGSRCSARGLRPARRTPVGACHLSKQGERLSGATSGPELQPSMPSDGPGPPQSTRAPATQAEPRRSQRAMRARKELPEPPSLDPRLGQRAPQRPTA